MVKHTFFIAWFLLFAQAGLSQKNNIKNLTTCSFGLSESDASKVYTEHFFKQSDYLDGKEYVPYYTRRAEIPLLEQGFGRGVLYKNGKTYEGLYCTYDYFLDRLIDNPMHGDLIASKVILNSLDIDSCSIFYQNQKKTHTLKKLKFDKTLKNRPEDGFYEVFYDGNMKLYAKHTARIVTLEGLQHYQHNHKFYLLKDNEFHLVKSKRKFLKIFPESKKQIRRSIRSNSRFFRKFRPSDLSDLLHFIESL